MIVLHADRTVDMEVKEVLKAQKVDRFRRIAATLRSVICRNTFIEPDKCRIKLIMPLPATDEMMNKQLNMRRHRTRGKNTSSKSQESWESTDLSTAVEITQRAVMGEVNPLLAQDRDQDAQSENDIFSVLHEYIRVTNLLVQDAVSMRRPHLERDERLIRNGFLKQARRDFLQLREDCMTEKQRTEIARKERRKRLLSAKKAKKEKKMLTKAKKNNIQKGVTMAIDQKNEENGNQLHFHRQCVYCHDLFYVVL